jgi:esterase/lipase superfamily enzyme
MPNPLRSSLVRSPSGGSSAPGADFVPSGGSAPPLPAAESTDIPAEIGPIEENPLANSPPPVASAPVLPDIPSLPADSGAAIIPETSAALPPQTPPMSVEAPAPTELDVRREERRSAIEAVLAERAKQDAKEQGAQPPTAPLADALPLLQPSAPAKANSHEQLFPVASDGSELVTVFYGTDRNLVQHSTQTLHTVLVRFSPMLLIGTTAVGLGIIAVAVQRRVVWMLFASSTAIALALGLFAGVVTWRNIGLAAKGARYGNERGTLQVGLCEVSIPPHHESGKLESPSILRAEITEDTRKHVVLKNTEPLQDEEFYRRLQAQVERSPQKEVFIFIHGYNNTFEDAVRRTGQMAHDLEYQGAAVCYSWPSQGGLFQYTVDETNVAWTTPHFKRFVLDIVAHANAEHVSLIAHSMGNRALTCALRDLALEMQETPPIFQQVVLAAPDIDADIFVRDIAPVLKNKAQSVTLYASSNDQALIASKLVHGYPRAGDSGELLVLIPGIDTIDVSEVDTSLLGHNYYGESDAILADICLLLQESKPPSQRSWLTPMAQNGLTYWVLQSAQAAAWVRTRPHAAR